MLDHVEAVLAEATLTVPEVAPAVGGGRAGLHTEALGYLLAEMQHLHPLAPGGDVVTRTRCVPRAWEIAAAVLDPEVPVLTIEDLGILRDVAEDDQGRVDVQITPTYSGCPAMDAIRDRHRRRADRRPATSHVDVEFVLSPAWTTDWMSDAGRPSSRRTASPRRPRARRRPGRR